MLSPLRAGKYSQGGSHHPSSRVLGQPAFKIQLIQEEDTPLQSTAQPDRSTALPFSLEDDGYVIIDLNKKLKADGSKKALHSRENMAKSKIKYFNSIADTKV